MTPLGWVESAIGVVVLAAIGWLGYTIGADRWELKYEQLQTQDQTASADALRAADTKIADLTAAYESKLKGINDANAVQIAAAAAHDDQLLASLHNYANALATRPVPGGGAAPGAVPGAPAGAGSAGSLADLSRRLAAAQRSVGEAITGAVRACSADSVELAGAQAERRAVSSLAN